MTVLQVPPNSAELESEAEISVPLLETETDKDRVEALEAFDRALNLGHEVTEEHHERSQAFWRKIFRLVVSNSTTQTHNCE